MSVEIVDRDRWLETAWAARESGDRLVSLWAADHRDTGAGFAVFAAYATAQGLAVTRLDLPARHPKYPEISGLYPAASRMQRAIRDLFAIEPEGAEDVRPWLMHVGDYPFVRVEGEGVHEIPVGPIHAGIIEPGHFRFSVVGEKVLRLEERLGYTHKGIARRFRDFSLAEGHKLAGRVSGDSTVAYAWAYAQAVESMAGVVVPPRATWLRALMLERERVANHLGDLGALGNDAAFGFALAQFMRLKEDWVRASERLFGHRFMMDRIVPGGVDLEPWTCDIADLAKEARSIGAEVATLRRIFDEHSGLQDRFLTTGRVTPELAYHLGLVGLAGRSSGQAFDLRVDHPWAPYGELGVAKVVHTAGDVAARVISRFEELAESLRLVEAISSRIPEGPSRVDLPTPAPGAFGAGWIEGWRGEVLVAVEAGAGGRIASAHAHDPSVHNWPLLEHAIMGNIVPDFPLINKSFNLSYSGADQ